MATGFRMARYRVVSSSDYDDLFLHKLDKTRYSVDIDEICIPLDLCVCARLGAIDSTLISTMDERGYDHAPVQVGDESGIGWRLVRVGTLRELHRLDSPLRKGGADFVNSDKIRISHHVVGLNEILDVMAGKEAAIAYTEGGPPPDWVQDHLSGDSSGGPLPGEIWGLITLSDLNSRAIRFALNELVVDLETQLAKFIRNRTSDPWDWIRRLQEHSQIQILGTLDLRRRKRVDANPIEAAMLTDLLQVVGGTPEFLGELGYTSRKEFEWKLKAIKDLRNRVMHPVRPVVSDVEDIGSLGRAVSVMLDMIGRANSVLRRQ